MLPARVSKFGFHRKPKAEGSNCHATTPTENVSLADAPVTSSPAGLLNTPSAPFPPSGSSVFESHNIRTVKESLKLALELAEKALDGLPIPGVKGSLGGLQTIIEKVEISHSNEKTLKALVNHIDTIRDQILGPVQGLKGSEIPNTRKSAIKRLFDKLSNLADEWKDRPVRGRLRRFIEASADREELAELEKNVDRAIQEFNLSAQGAMWAAHERSECLRILDSLPRVPEACFDSGRADGPTQCFEGTRVQVLKQLEAWIQDTSTDQPRVLWLNGLAGIGKSTIAKTIAARTEKRGILGGSFFFSRNESELSRADRVIPTLAFQLAHSHADFLETLAAALQSDPDCAHKGLQLQFDKLIIGPLIAAAPSIPRKRIVLLVLDALDECSSELLAVELLHLFLARANEIPFQLRIFITSRPEHHIRRVFDEADTRSHYSKYILHDIDASIVRKDIERYLEHHLHQIPMQLQLSLSHAWPREEDMNILVDKSGKLFIYAATAIRFIQSDRTRNPQARMEILLGARKAVNAKPYAQLDQLYHGILSNALPSDSEPGDFERFRWVIGCIVLLRNPLPLLALARFVEYSEEDVTSILYHLHSIILAPSSHNQAPHIYHPSFPDFITDPERCTDRMFTVDVRLQERQIALRCLRLMTEHLKRDVANIGNSSLLNTDSEVQEKIATGLSLEFRYACQFWSSHLLRVAHSDGEVVEELRKFAFSRLLYWFEAMSLLRAITTVGPSMKDVHRWAVESKCDSDLIHLLNDGYRFILASSRPISERALHVYETALPFTPPDTLLYKTYEHELTNSVRVLHGAHQSWSSCLSVAPSHGGPITALDISPDGSRIAIGAERGIISLWDLVSVTLIQTIKLDREISSLVFSHDGTRICIAEASDKNPAIVVWDTVAGVRIHTLNGHQKHINSISMSTQKAHLASASSDTTLKVWDVDAGNRIATLQADSERVCSAVFVPNSASSRIVASSSAGIIRLWNVNTKTVLATFDGGRRPIRCIDVSPNGQYMASGSVDTDVRLFDLASQTHKPIRTMKDHTGFVNSVHFHPLDSQLVSGCENHVAVLWDWKSDTRVLLRDHMSKITTVRYSPDGARLVTASSDSTWRMWDISVPYAAESNSDEHTRCVQCATFSGDGTLLVTGSNDCTVKVWNTSSGKIVHTLRGHEEAITSLAFSLDGVMLASGGSWDKTIRLWNVKTGGESTNVLTGHNGRVENITFTDDGHLLAQTDNETIKWDLSKLGSGPVERKSIGYTRSYTHMRASSEEYTVKMEDGRWLSLRKGESVKHLAYIPEDYPTYELQFSKDTVAITCTDGHVLIIDISLTKKEFV